MLPQPEIVAGDAGIITLHSTPIVRHPATVVRYLSIIAPQAGSFALLYKIVAPHPVQVLLPQFTKRCSDVLLNRCRLGQRRFQPASMIQSCHHFQQFPLEGDLGAVGASSHKELSFGL